MVSELTIRVNDNFQKWTKDGVTVETGNVMAYEHAAVNCVPEGPEHLGVRTKTQEVRLMTKG